MSSVLPSSNTVRSTRSPLTEASTRTGTIQELPVSASLPANANRCCSNRIPVPVDVTDTRGWPPWRIQVFIIAPTSTPVASASDSHRSGVSVFA